jgi:hypothetical protein
MHFEQAADYLRQRVTFEQRRERCIGQLSEPIASRSGDWSSRLRTPTNARAQLRLEITLGCP